MRPAFPRRLVPKVISLLVLPLVLLAVWVGMEVAERGSHARWRVELDKYLAYKSTSAGQVTVVRTARARRPWQFGADGVRAQILSQTTFGDQPYYRVDRTYREGWNGPRPLPYPPQQAYCVLLEQKHSAEGLGYMVVLVALHQDLYNAAWVVHEGGEAPYAAQFVAGLSEIGCDLRLDRADYRLDERLRRAFAPPGGNRFQGYRQIGHYLGHATLWRSAADLPLAQIALLPASGPPLRQALEAPAARPDFRHGMERTDN